MFGILLFKFGVDDTALVAELLAPQPILIQKEICGSRNLIYSNLEKTLK
jgi:hypothetical protein